MVDKVGFSVIGCGYIAQAEHLPAFQRISNANLVATADVNKALTKRLAEVYGAKRWFKDYKYLLKLEEVHLAVAVPHRYDSVVWKTR